MGAPKYQVSHDAQGALTEYSDAFNAAYVIAEDSDLASQFGLVYPMNGQLQAVFPIPVSVPGWWEFKGDHKFRDLGERSMSVTLKTWQTGVREKVARIRSVSWNGWGDAPAQAATMLARLPSKLVGEMLALNSYQGPLLDFYREELPGGSTASTLYLFDEHPINPLLPATGTNVFTNYKASGTYTSIDEALIKHMKEYFASLKDPSGEYLGLELTHLFFNPARKQEAEDFFDISMVARPVKNEAGSENVAAIAVENRHRGSVTPVEWKQWGSGFDDLVIGYAQAAPKPWVVATDGPPEELTWDENSDYFKETGGNTEGYIKTSRIAKLDVKATLPHALYKVDLS